MVCMSMDKKGVWVLVLLLVWFSVSSVSNGNKGDEYDEEERKKSGLWEWQKLRSAYVVYEALLPTSIAYSCWSLLKDMFHQAHLHFFPPNIDFRRGEQDVTTGEVVTDAFAKSVGTSKATLEDAAKSAAQTVHNVVKKATSSHDAETKQRHNQNQNQNQNEL